VRRLPDGTVFADMGKVFSAVPSITFGAGTAGRAITLTTSYRRNNTTLAAASAPGARGVSLVEASNRHDGLCRHRVQGRVRPHLRAAGSRPAQTMKK
jgi:hypothetical protein